jgi:hypothetical protein
MSGNRNQGFFGFLSPLVTAVHAPTSHNSSPAQPIRVFIPIRWRRTRPSRSLETADNCLRTAFQNSPAAKIPERFHSPAQRKRVISHTKVCPRERARSYIQPKPNVALESTRLCGHDQPVDSVSSHEHMFFVQRVFTKKKRPWAPCSSGADESCPVLQYAGSARLARRCHRGLC